MNLIGNLILLGMALCCLFVAVLIFALVPSIPGWVAGRIAASNSPQLRSARQTSRYWAMWAILGGAPLAASIVGGPFVGTNQFLPTASAVALGIFALITLNVNAFFIGYKQGLAAKAKRDISKTSRSSLEFTGSTSEDADWLDERHPAVTSDTPGSPSMETRPLPLVDASPSPGDNEYPTARPHGH